MQGCINGSEDRDHSTVHESCMQVCQPCVMHASRLTKNGVCTFMKLRRLRMNSGDKKEVKLCLCTVGGSGNMFLCSLAGVCLFLSLLVGVCGATSKSNPTHTAQTSVP